MPRLEIQNNGQQIAASNYWGGELDRAGTLHLSLNAGCYRLLLPTGWEKEIAEMESAREVIVSRGPLDGHDALELLFEDGTDDPYAVHLGVDQTNAVPPADQQGRTFDFAVWTNRRGTPHESLRRPCRYRIVDRLPYLKSWGQ